MKYLVAFAEHCNVCVGIDLVDQRPTDHKPSKFPPCVPASIGLILFTIVASIMLLNFWDMEGPSRESAMNGFLSNIAIIGGLLLAAAGAI